MKRELARELASLFATEGAHATDDGEREHLQSCARWWSDRASWGPTLKEELAARGYLLAVSVHGYGGSGGMFYVRRGRIVTRKTASQGWPWLARFDRKLAALRMRRAA